MTRVFRRSLAALALVALCSPTRVSAGSRSDQATASAPSGRCVSVPLPSVRGADGNATELATAVRQLVADFLAGPSLRAVTLDARLADQAQEEARQKDCSTVLTITLTRKKGGGGVFGRVVGDAAGAAAWHMPYGGSAASTAARSAAIVGSTAVSSMASNTRAKDELQIEYRLASGGSTTLRDGKDSAKAKADGEDLLTPLVERMATAVAAAVPK